MKHVLIVYGKPKGHGRNRKNVPLYVGPVITKAAHNANKWLVENFRGLGPTPEEIKS